MTLIGTIDFRKGWFGGLSLQVEEEVKGRFSGKAKRRWRRATLMDLAQPELRILVDMRSRPYSLLSTSLRSALPTLAADFASPGRPTDAEQGRTVARMRQDEPGHTRAA